MLKINNKLEDFEYMAHKVDEFSFEYPNIKDSEYEDEYEVDYDISNIIEGEKTEIGLHLAFPKFIVHVIVEDEIIIKLVISGVFIGRSMENDFKVFENWVKNRGLEMLISFANIYLYKVTSNIGLEKPLKLPMIKVSNLIEQKEKNINSKKKQ